MPPVTSFLLYGTSACNQAPAQWPSKAMEDGLNVRVPGIRRSIQIIPVGNKPGDEISLSPSISSSLTVIQDFK